jgi:hypothetical protein
MQFKKISGGMIATGVLVPPCAVPANVAVTLPVNELVLA